MMKMIMMIIISILMGRGAFKENKVAALLEYVPEA